mgnify:CR=1 FL=1
MEEWTFENADMSDTVMHRAKKYVDNWEEMKRNHIGCLSAQEAAEYGLIDSVITNR